MLGVVGTARAGDAGKVDDPVDKQVLRLEREWGEAIVKRDTVVIDRVLADDYVLVTPEGLMVTKADVIENIKKTPPGPRFVIKEVDLGRAAVRVYGDAAVVTSRFTLKGMVQERAVETPFRHTDVFVKSDGQWRCVSRQATRIAESYGH